MPFKLWISVTNSSLLLDGLDRKSMGQFRRYYSAQIGFQSLYRTVTFLRRQLVKMTWALGYAL